MTTNNAETKIVKKHFWPWEDDMEEAWLSDMASKGWHFAKFKGRMKYCFVKGKPKKVRYCLDYQTDSADKDNYNALFQDAGWEYVGTLKSWQYFRKEYDEDTVPEIFTDNDSKIQKYYKILGIYSVILLFCITIISLLFSTLFDRVNSKVIEFTKGFFTGSSVVLVLFFVFLVSALMSKINHIKKL